MGVLLSACAGEGGTSDASQSGGSAAPGLSYFAGGNCYYLLTRAASEGHLTEVVDVLDGAHAIGMTVLRTWAFNDGPEEWNALQVAPGQYDERVFAALDWLIYECGHRGLKLMLCLTNYWPDFGGMQQYVRWSRGLAKGEADVTSEEFFMDERCQEMYRHYIQDVLNRRNTITGKLYKDDPAIHSWDIANEPRCSGDSTCDVLDRWISETAAFVKSLDSLHPVTVGSEGFFGPSAPHLLRHNPYDCSGMGVDFVRHSRSADLDYVCIHQWIDQWCPDMAEPTKVAWTHKWLESHMDACTKLLGGKALVLQEFGKRPSGEGRKKIYEKVYATAASSVATGGVLRGTMMWTLAAGSYEDYDGYTVYVPGSAAECEHCTSSRESCAAVRGVIGAHCSLAHRRGAA